MNSKKKSIRKTFAYAGTKYPYELYIGGVKRLNLRIRPDGSIRLSVPRGTAPGQIDAFLGRYADRIAKVVARNQNRRRAASNATPEDEAVRKARLLTIIHDCHQNLVIPSMSELELTDEQRRFITSPKAIRVHPMKTRWGSCNFQKGTLNFNLYLIDRPLECVEYVVMHEFAHFVCPDHSAAYRALMTQLMPDWKARKQLLNSETKPSFPRK
jgi:predicted metal-dependent hydrolase